MKRVYRVSTFNSLCHINRLSCFAIKLHCLSHLFLDLVKRAQEVMMFGNQQNKPRIKKSDPDVPALPDLKGSVTANKAEDVAETKTAELPKAIEKELDDVSDDVTEPKESEDITSESGEPTTDELLEDFPPETVEALKELENAKNDKEGKSSEESDNNASEKTSEENNKSDDNSVQRTGNDEDMMEVLPEEWYSKYSWKNTISIKERLCSNYTYESGIDLFYFFNPRFPQEENDAIWAKMYISFINNYYQCTSI